MQSQSVQYRCPAPAKINLFLHITSQRSDGYHNLQTLFQFTEFCDWLTFSLNSTDDIVLTGDSVGISPEDNLIYKAALLLKFKTKCPLGAKIDLEKNIPSGAGLGGGSSDAATTLLVLNKLWDLKLTNDELSAIGLTLGADVPIFIHGNSAFAEGVGEKLINAELSELDIVLAMPKQTSISTQIIFTHPDLPRDSAKIDFSAYQFAKTRNDCEMIVRQSYPAVANTLSWLVEYAPSRMTGTGACCFALFNNRSSADEMVKHSPNFVDCYVTKTCNTSSAHDFIATHFKN
ncbi:4-(cytidine 5'-diphospho)-2-C-methyl-D-erythritol kinase [Algibacillus agarilyticus]|uniref:4-(cytidine 5'-diphospho)-2-C-methyl-D-erythritol kinase n=1 Tax=Algibacillus agarilyticus TaxID=2234133 RepID=UPI000DD0BA8D|nr:4-(cytidine 5'-diphospho)-2-C-methyl-D-erythritol kinase [Algibacillus agarilyticus]